MSVLPRRAFALGALSAVAAAGLAACGSSDSGSSTAETTAASAAAEDGAVGGHCTVVFEVTSTTATMADITLMSVDVNGAPVEEQITNQSLPFSKTVEVDPALGVDMSTLSISAQVTDGTDVSVTMTVDGNEVTSSAEGESASAMVRGDSE